MLLIASKEAFQVHWKFHCPSSNMARASKSSYLELFQKIVVLFYS